MHKNDISEVILLHDNDCPRRYSRETNKRAFLFYFLDLTYFIQKFEKEDSSIILSTLVIEVVRCNIEYDILPMKHRSCAHQMILNSGNFIPTNSY